MPNLDNNDRAGWIIITHRTPVWEAISELIQAFFAYFFQVNANQCIEVRFTIKPLYFQTELDDGSTER